MSNVVLQVYDLSQGMARMMSRAIIGRQIDGIWHTSVVVYGLEYFYGGGIARMPPKTTPYGMPVREETMGQTTKTKSEFEAFITKLNPRYCMEGYHILYHNCNNFTNDCLAFLLGTSLPADIKDLPMEFLNTPMGKSFEPMINRMMQMTSSFGDAPQHVNEDIISHAMIFPEAALVNVTSHDQLHTLMRQDKCVLIFWEAETVLEFSEAINLLPVNFPSVTFGCVDSTRFPYLAPVEVPQIHIYEGDKLTLRLTEYNLKALRKALGGNTRPDIKLKVLAWDKPRILPIDWTIARGDFITLVQGGRIDAVDPQHMETIAKWMKRNVVLNIPEFVTALSEVVKRVAESAPAFALLASLAQQPHSNAEISKIIGSALPSIVGKSPLTQVQFAFLVNLSAHPSGQSLLKAQVPSLLPVLLSALSSDDELVTSAASIALVTLQRMLGSPLSVEDSQELAVALFDRLNTVEVPESIENVACALAMLLSSREEVTDLIRELGVEAAEGKLLSSENARLREIGADLKKLWEAQSD